MYKRWTALALSLLLAFSAVGALAESAPGVSRDGYGRRPGARSPLMRSRKPS